MADVTISSLPLGTPSGNALLPYSEGNTTYSARPSAIVAASSGSVLQMQFVPYVDRYIRDPLNSSAWETIGPALTLTTKGTNSKIFLSNNISVSVLGTATYPACLFSFIRNGAEITSKSFGIVTVDFGARLGWDNRHIQFVDQPNVSAGTQLIYYLGVRARTDSYYNPSSIQINDNAAGTITHFVAMEIAA